MYAGLLGIIRNPYLMCMLLNTNWQALLFKIRENPFLDLLFYSAKQKKAENQTYFSIKAFKVFLPKNLPKTRMCCREDGTFNRVRAEMEKIKSERFKEENCCEEIYRIVGELTVRTV